MSEPVTAIAHYRVKPGCEDQFLAIIDQHWPLLHSLELATDREPQVYLGAERGIPGPLVIEIFEWTEENGSRRAHQHPEVSRVWESMGPLCEERGGRPAMEFPNLRRLRP